MPELLDLGHLGEEPVSSEIETPSVTFHGPADTTDHVIGFENG